MPMVVSYTCKIQRAPPRQVMALIVGLCALWAVSAASASEASNGCREAYSDYLNTIYACNLVIAKPSLATPHLIRALQIRAQALLASGRPLAAIRDYSIAIDRLPVGRLQGYILYLRGTTRLKYLRDGQKTGTADLERANRQAPANTRILEALAGAYANQDRQRDAIGMASRVLDVDPRSVIARKIRARALELTGQSHLAIKDLDKLISDTPRDYDLSLWRGRIHHLRNNLHAALADYRNAARVKSTDELLTKIESLERALGQ